MAKGWFLLAVFLTAISDVAIAGEAAEPAGSSQATAAQTTDSGMSVTELKRFVYLYPNRAPAVSNLDKLFPDTIEIGKKELLALLDGDKGAVAKRETIRSLGIPLFNLPPPLDQKSFVPNEPDAKFIAAIRDHLINNRFRTKVYEGRNCRVVTRNGEQKLEGNCNYEAAYPLSYKHGMTRYPMTPVGFDVHAIVFDPVLLESGPFKGQWVHSVITTRFVRGPEKVQGTDRLAREFQPCLNGFAEPAEQPQPAPPPAGGPPPTPAPIAPAPMAQANATATVNIEAPKIIRTADVFLTKCYVKGDDLLGKLPRNYRDVRFIGISNGTSYTSEILGPRSVPQINGEENRQAECVDLIFRNIRFGEDGPVELAIREVEVPEGFRDRTGKMTIQVFDGSKLLIDPNTYPQWFNEKEGFSWRNFCGKAYWRCWIVPAIVGGYYGGKEIFANEDAPDTESPNCLGSKCGGAGKSPIVMAITISR